MSLANTYISEDIVWDEFKKGNKYAFERIYLQFSEKLYTYGMTICWNKTLVQDSIQDLFIDLWKYRENLSDLKKLEFYLIKSLRTKIYHQIRQWNQYDRSNKVFFENETDAHVEIKFFYGDSSKDNIQLRKHINQLPPQQRELILLIFFEKRTYEEAAEILSIQVKSVYTQVRRAVKALKGKVKITN